MDISSLQLSGLSTQTNLSLSNLHSLQFLTLLSSELTQLAVITHLGIEIKCSLLISISSVAESGHLVQTISSGIANGPG